MVVTKEVSINTLDDLVTLDLDILMLNVGYDTKMIKQVIEHDNIDYENLEILCMLLGILVNFK